MQPDEKSARNVTFRHPLFERKALQFAQIGAGAERAVARASNDQQTRASGLELADAIAQRLNDGAGERIHLGGAFNPEQRALGQRLDAEVSHGGVPKNRGRCQAAILSLR